MCLNNLDEPFIEVNVLSLIADETLDNSDIDSDSSDDGSPLLPAPEIPWFMQYPPDTHFEQYKDQIDLLSDTEIIEHYTDCYPDYAVPILSKGTSYELFSRMHNIELNVVNTPFGLVFDVDCLIHCKGIFYQTKDNPINRYCCDCIYNNITTDKDEVNAFMQHELLFDAFEAGITFSNINVYHKYWCTICNTFLYNVECYTDNHCFHCEDLINYSDDNSKTISLIQNEISFYYSIPISVTDFYDISD